MNILALDLGTQTGWASLYGESVESGTESFDLKRGESGGMRYLHFRRWLSDDMVVPGYLNLMVYEQTHQRGGAATEVAAGLATRVQEIAAEHGIDYAAVHSATLKKWATGKGNADKGAMIEAAANIGSRLPQLQRVADEFMDRWNAWCDKEKPNKAKVDSSPFSDEADAICLLGYALSELVPQAEVAEELGKGAK